LIDDDYWRKLWIYLEKTKDEAFKNFKSYKHLVENQIDKMVKFFKTNNGLEFCFELFNTFYIEHDITRHQTIAWTPQKK